VEVGDPFRAERGSTDNNIICWRVRKPVASTDYAMKPHTTGLANTAAVHGDITAFWWAVGIFVLGFLLAMVILPGRAKPLVPTVRAALARHAIGNCHYFEAADGARHGLGATTIPIGPKRPF
jgi:hypothetical protein